MKLHSSRCFVLIFVHKTRRAELKFPPKLWCFFTQKSPTEGHESVSSSLGYGLKILGQPGFATSVGQRYHLIQNSGKATSKHFITFPGNIQIKKEHLLRNTVAFVLKVIIIYLSSSSKRLAVMALLKFVSFVYLNDACLSAISYINTHTYVA